jgi:hypothetical protein
MTPARHSLKPAQPAQELRRPHLTIGQILAWADAHRERTGQWPLVYSGPVHDETWRILDTALRTGCRGLPGGSSLPQLLRKCRGVPIWRSRLPSLSIGQILKWADAYRKKTGRWPGVDSGEAAPGETWERVNEALSRGHRGLQGGSSLAKLLAKRRGKPNKQALPPFSIEQILSWADAHHQRTGEWPRTISGPVEGETWNRINHALRDGGRGLPGGSSLMILLAEHRNVRNRSSLPKLTVKQILRWADAHHRRTGGWPKCNSCPVLEAPDEHWKAIDQCLRLGSRGLPGGLSLKALLGKRRGLGNNQQKSG